MRAPLSWIREFTPLDAPVADIVSALNQLGLEVEGVEQPGAEITGVVAARVLNVERHPNADKLSLVDVTTGASETRVVCGAPNVVAGMAVPYAPAGATLPGGFTLERRKIRGQVSDGMLCSAKELGLGDDHSGILDLDPATELGTDVREVLGLDDVIFDLAITPNRPDAMCIVGVARELAAHFSLDFTVPEPVALADASVANDITVVVEDAGAVPPLPRPGRPGHDGPVARVDGAAPGEGGHAADQQRRRRHQLRAARAQPAAARVRPLPARGRGIVVRLADDGETMTTLDGVERVLTHEDLLICDAERRPQAIAGIMGGSTSEVSDATTEILLESAYFERMGIARTSKRLKLRSESSARFERGIDPDAVARNAERAMELLVEVAGAQVAPDACDVYPAPVDAAARPPAREPRERGPRHRPRRRGRVGLAGAARDRARRRPGRRRRPATQWWRWSRPSGPTSNARSTSWRRSPAASASTASAGPCPTPTVRSACSPPVSRSAVWSPTRSSASGSPRRSPCRWSRRATSSAPVRRSTGWCAPPTRCGRRSRSCAPRCCRGCCGRSPATGPTASPTSPCSRWAGCSSPRSAPRRPTLRSPTSPSTSRWRWRAPCVRRPVEDDRPVDVYDAVDAVTAVVDALGIARRDAWSPRHLPGYRAGRAARVVVGGHEAGTVGEVAPEVLAALGLEAPVVDGRARCSTRSSTPPAATARSARRRASRRRPSTSRSCSTSVSPPPTSSRTLRGRGRRRARGRARCSTCSVRTRSAPGSGASRSRCASGRPTARSPTPRSATFRQRAIDAVTTAHGAELRG